MIEAEFLCKSMQAHASTSREYLFPVITRFFLIILTSTVIKTMIMRSVCQVRNLSLKHLKCIL